MKTILLVEDNERLTNALATLLRQSGYRVLTAFDGLYGVSMALRHKPDLLVLDVAMPAGGGFSVAERVRRRSEVEVPIIFLSGRTEPGFRRRATGLGAAAYLEKPIDPDVLLTAIEEALKESRAGAAA